MRTALHSRNISMPPRNHGKSVSRGILKKQGQHLDCCRCIDHYGSNGASASGRSSGSTGGWRTGAGQESAAVRGILPMTVMAREQGCLPYIVPKENLKEAEMVENIPVAGACSLEEFVQIVKKRAWTKEKNHIEDNKREMSWEQDFADIRGQVPAKRAALGSRRVS